MDGADVTIAWIDNSMGPRAQDYHLQRNNRVQVSQCTGDLVFLFMKEGFFLLLSYYGFKVVVSTSYAYMMTISSLPVFTETTLWLAKKLYLCNF